MVYGKKRGRDKPRRARRAKSVSCMVYGVWGRKEKNKAMRLIKEHEVKKTALKGRDIQEPNA